MNRSELQKLIDSCRGEADLQLPEVEPLREMIATDPVVQRRWEKSQQMDAEFRQIIRDVPVPSGLEGRLLAALQLTESGVPDASFPDAARPDATRPDDGRPHVCNVDVLVEPLPESDVTRVSRPIRWRTWAAAVAGVAAIVLVAVFLLPAGEPQLASEDQARELAVTWIGQVDDAKWQDANAPQRFVLPSQLPKRFHRWQAVSTGSRAIQVVCYELASAGSRAFLFVAWTKQPTTLPTSPPSSTYPKGAWDVAVWKPSGNAPGLVYLLAVQQGSKQYQELIRGSSSIALRKATARKSSLAGKV